ncbi:hypothetical protein CLOLEP_01965 [[Clostridium] leptum DSM 753]|uniref:Uncharacterized protein n=1 Tax=[Clostridium] leptum DSM 753 TaxID=428125 RepID=A7VTS1_9FIRM|nr:hypothetical protein CLOLEP_01965 [[Clostridium] leptum DSM 753]
MIIIPIFSHFLNGAPVLLFIKFWLTEALPFLYSDFTLSMDISLIFRFLSCPED